jgi:nitrite reductase/ring-hydroxylating ferredoxin subunit
MPLTISAATTCPLHYATFDVRTGKKLSDPYVGMPAGMKIIEKLGGEVLKDIYKTGDVIEEIETPDLETYETNVKDGSVLIRI